MRYSYALVLCCHVALYLSATSYPSRTVHIHSLCRYGDLRCIIAHGCVHAAVLPRILQCLLLRIVGATATDAVTYMCYAVMLPRFLQCNWLFCTNSYTHSSSYGYDCVCVLLRCYAIMEGYYLTAYIHSCCRFGHWHCVYVHSVMC